MKPLDIRHLSLHSQRLSEPVTTIQLSTTDSHGPPVAGGRGVRRLPS
jgi:hypothetical protein